MGDEGAVVESLPHSDHCTRGNPRPGSTIATPPVSPRRRPPPPSDVERGVEEAISRYFSPRKDDPGEAETETQGQPTGAEEESRDDHWWGTPSPKFKEGHRSHFASPGPKDTSNTPLWIPNLAIPADIAEEGNTAFPPHSPTRTGSESQGVFTFMCSRQKQRSARASPSGGEQEHGGSNTPDDKRGSFTEQLTNNWLSDRSSMIAKKVQTYLKGVKLGIVDDATFTVWQNEANNSASYSVKPKPGCNPNPVIIASHAAKQATVQFWCFEDFHEWCSDQPDFKDWQFYFKEELAADSNKARAFLSETRQRSGELEETGTEAM